MNSLWSLLFQQSIIKVLFFFLFIFMAIYVNFFYFRPLEIKYRKPYVFTSSEHGYIGLGGNSYSTRSGVQGFWKLEVGGRTWKCVSPVSYFPIRSGMFESDTLQQVHIMEVAYQRCVITQLVRNGGEHKLTDKELNHLKYKKTYPVYSLEYKIHMLIFLNFFLFFFCMHIFKFYLDNFVTNKEKNHG